MFYKPRWLCNGRWFWSIIIVDRFLMMVWQKADHFGNSPNETLIRYKEFYYTAITNNDLFFRCRLWLITLYPSLICKGNTEVHQRKMNATNTIDWSNFSGAVIVALLSKTLLWGTAITDMCMEEWLSLLKHTSLIRITKSDSTSWNTRLFLLDQ